jgi:F-type H+-transporting ATPase subunit delta
VLTSRLDPSIIGGAVTRLGSTVYDGSITTQLQKMKQALVEAG